MKLLRQAGDFGNSSVVEYATINITIPNEYLPENLQHNNWDVNDDTLITLSVSPSGRLSKKQLYLNSIELVNSFFVYLESIFTKRSYKDNYKMEIVVDTSTWMKRVTKAKDEHSEKVLALLSD